jgi:hypothetical protein
MRTRFPKGSVGNQTVGNIGLYFVCYRLSRYGWNVMPTARNAKGVDIVAYSQSAKRTITIQVKALSKRAPVPFGSKLDSLFADYVVVCNKLSTGEPECFVLIPQEIRKLIHKGIKDSKMSYWLQPKDYEKDQYRERWDRIGTGVEG